MKKLVALLLCMAMFLTFAACGESSEGSPSGKMNAQKNTATEVEEEVPTEIPDMIGLYRVVGANNDGDFTFAIINNEQIGIFLIFDEESQINTYWYGSFTYPTTAEKSYTFVSESKPEMYESSILTEDATTKTFEYKDGLLNCDITLFGITTQIQLEKVENDSTEGSLEDSVEEMIGSIGSIGEESTPEQTPEEETSAAASDGKNIAEWADSRVEIKSAFLSTDYDGNSVIVVNFSWTNNSDETTSAAWSTICKAFQNGIEIESAYLVESPSYDAGPHLADVRPGTTIDVQYAFVLSDTTSPVEVEIENAMNFDETSIAYMEFDPTQLSTQ